MFIYLIVNHVTGKYYVGQHKGNDLRKYLQQKFSHAKSGASGGSYLFNSMRAHSDKSAWSIHALRSDIQDKTELNQTEKDFIKFLRAQDPEYGYNIHRGGEGGRTEGNPGKCTPEVCAKMAGVVRKIWSNPQTRAKQSETVKKLWSDPAYRARITEAARAAKLRPEVRSKLSEFAKRRWARPDYQAHRAEADKKKWADQKVRDNHLKAMRKRWSDPEASARIRARMSEASRKRWSVPGARARHAEITREAMSKLPA